jgi:hypothetical protein
MIWRAYVLTAPDSVRAVITGLIFGAFMTIAPWSGSHGGWTERILLGVVEGAVFGVYMAWSYKRDFDANRVELRALPPDQRRTAVRAVTRDPVPSDSATRAAALHYAQQSLELTKRRWRMGVIVYFAMLAISAVLALTGSPWWWLGFAFVAGLLVKFLQSPRRLEQRVAALSGGTTAQAV